MQNHELYDNRNNKENLSKCIFLWLFLIDMYLIVLVLLNSIKLLIDILYDRLTILFLFCYFSYENVPITIIFLIIVTFCTTSSFHEYTLPKHPLKFANGWLKLCHHEQKNCFRVLCRDSTPLYTYQFFNSMKYINSCKDIEFYLNFILLS